jgi:hypothetical protein
MAGFFGSLFSGYPVIRSGDDFPAMVEKFGKLVEYAKSSGDYGRQPQLKKLIDMLTIYLNYYAAGRPFSVEDLRALQGDLLRIKNPPLESLMNFLAGFQTVARRAEAERRRETAELLARMPSLGPAYAAELERGLAALRSARGGKRTRRHRSRRHRTRRHRTVH